MGLEAECSIRVGKKSFEGRALLEGETMQLRGDITLRIPFGELRDLRVEGDDLLVRTDAQEIRLALGAATAERWLRFVKEPKELFEKLELGPGARVAVVDVTDVLFLTALRERAAGVSEGRVPEGAPIIFFQVESHDALRRLPLLRARMIPTGVLWLVRPKASKAVPESDVFEAARAWGLVDVKVVAFSRTHTAHKLVIPLELRGQPFRPPPVVSIPPSAPSMVAPRKAPGALAKAAPRPAPKPAPKHAPASTSKPKPKPKPKPTAAPEARPPKKAEKKPEKAKDGKKDKSKRGNRDKRDRKEKKKDRKKDRKRK